jgi:gamma-glutamylaminecyclotransferase
MRHRVFVFGTLKEGFPNFHINDGRRIGTTFTTVERYPLYLIGDRCSPWLVDSPGSGERVIGQVFEVDDFVLQAMDRLERVGQFDGYKRRTIQVCAGAVEKPMVVHVYFKEPKEVCESEVRDGPLAEYTLMHAKHYRCRGS